jgi:hypothetical protein
LRDGDRDNDPALRYGMPELRLQCQRRVNLNDPKKSSFMLPRCAMLRQAAFADCDDEQCHDQRKSTI